MITIKPHQTCLGLFLLLLGLTILVGCPATTVSTDEASQIEGLFTETPGGADDYTIVDCSLPGRIMRLGTGMMYLTRGPSRKLEARECALQGGRFAFPGQTPYQKALLVWMPDAQKGNPQAQYYVGQIYQRGRGGVPDYVHAAEWYRRAAEKGDSRAQMSLGYLYEKGLGVDKDRQEALRWYRKASGLGDSVILDENTLSIEERVELHKLRQENKQREEKTRMLQQKLEQIQKELEDARRKLEQYGAKIESKTNRQNISVLKEQIAEKERESKELREKLTRNEAIIKNLPAPRIEIYTTAPPETVRGVKLVVGRQDAKQWVIMGKVWAAAGLSRFEVNRKNITVGPDGDFKISLTDKPSGNSTVELTAVDKRGKINSIRQNLNRSFAMLAQESDIPGIEKIDFGRYHALIIGNNTYSKLAPLRTAANDAKRVAEILRGKYGFNTKVLIDASRLAIIEAIEHLKDELKFEDNLLIYYAGHSTMDQTNKAGYWQPVDADVNGTAHWIRLEDITDKINLMAAKQVLIIADACYSGPLTKLQLRGTGYGSSRKIEASQIADVRLYYFEQLARSRARSVLTSGGFAPVLDEGGEGHSVFAGILLNFLERNDRVLEARRLHLEIVAPVTNESRKLGYPQSPQYASIINAGENSGDFIFVPRKNK